MIYLNFILDYVITLITPYNTYFITNNLSKNKLIDVIIISLIIDSIYFHIPLNTVILPILYLISKKININKKYNIIKNILIFIIYFNMSFFIIDFNINNYLLYFLIGFITELIYSLITNKYI